MLASSRDRCCGHADDGLFIGNITYDDRSRTYDTPFPDVYMVDEDSPRADEGALPQRDIAGDDGTRAHVDSVAYDAVMVNTGSGIYDDM